MNVYFNTCSELEEYEGYVTPMTVAEVYELFGYSGISSTEYACDVVYIDRYIINDVQDQIFLVNEDVDGNLLEVFYDGTKRVWVRGNQFDWILPCSVFKPYNDEEYEVGNMEELF